MIKKTDAEIAQAARARNRGAQTKWRERANAYARAHGYSSYVSLLSALVRGEVRLVKRK